jgi:hypothetical protein
MSSTSWQVFSTPDVVATSIGELHFLDGAPTVGLPNHIRLGIQ